MAYGTKKHIILYVTSSYEGGLLVCGENSVCENNDDKYVPIVLGRDLSMKFELSCLSNKS